MVALVAVAGGYVIFAYDASERMTDEEVIRSVERKRPHNFARHEWTVVRGDQWEVWLVAAIRRVVREVCEKHEAEFYSWLWALPPLFPPDPPAPYVDPWASIEAPAEWFE